MVLHVCLVVGHKMNQKNKMGKSETGFLELEILQTQRMFLKLKHFIFKNLENTFSVFSVMNVSQTLQNTLLLLQIEIHH